MSMSILDLLLPVGSAQVGLTSPLSLSHPTCKMGPSLGSFPVWELNTQQVAVSFRSATDLPAIQLLCLGEAFWDS